MLSTTNDKGRLKQFKRWWKQYKKEINKQCKKCRHKYVLCEHCYNYNVEIINKKIDEFGVKKMINKLEYKI